MPRYRADKVARRKKADVTAGPAATSPKSDETQPLDIKSAKAGEGELSLAGLIGSGNWALKSISDM
jgi:hypothetical protein